MPRKAATRLDYFKESGMAYPTGFPEQMNSYEAARRWERALGFEHIENAHLVGQGPEARLERLEALVANELVNPGSSKSLSSAWRSGPRSCCPSSMRNTKLLRRTRLEICHPTSDDLEERVRSRGRPSPIKRTLGIDLA
jgi:hypothetical protein